MLALATTAIAWVIFIAVALFWVVYYFANRNSARPELGSEIELAPNRKRYYEDEVLEGSRLERVQLLGVLFLVVMVLGLPLYWIFEPDRLAGATDQKEATFIAYGAELYATTAEGGFNCAGCHGAKGGGGSAPYTVTDPLTGEVQAVTWLAPAIDTVLYRFSEGEVKFILQYGRPFSPMSPWGLEGGGPMNDQQLDTLISYMRSFQIERVGCAANETNTRTCASGFLPEDVQQRITEAADVAAADLVESGKYETAEQAMGEALFNLDINSGAYSCARCHTPGWSYGDPGVAGQGAFGWNLTGGSPAKHFPDEQAQIDFISAGSEFGKKYGVQGQGSGRMPAFGNLLTQEQIKAIVEYTRSL